MPRPTSTVLAVLAATAGLGLAAASAAEDPAGRYTMTPTDGGFIRLDTQTGAVSMCASKDGSWGCRALPDDQKALQDRIARLEEENRALKEENRRLEDVMGLNPDQPKPDATPGAPGEVAPQSPPGQGFKMPSEKDLDKAFDYVEGMMKKFRERLKKLEEEKKDGTVPL